MPLQRGEVLPLGLAGLEEARGQGLRLWGARKATGGQVRSGAAEGVQEIIAGGGDQEELRGQEMRS
jgi:hypothetical protein